MYPVASEENIKALLEQCRTIAIVGLSDKPHRDSFKVAQYLQEQGYRIIPVHPRIKEVLGERVYPTLAEIPEPVDMVNVFRKSEDTPEVVRQALPLKPKAIWLQLGIANEEAGRLAAESGIPYIQDRCIKVDHARLMQNEA